MNHAILLDHLRYDPLTGFFIRLRGTGKGAHVGAVAGSITKSGYVSITVLRGRVLAHRLAWFYTTGAWPTGVIDHIDRNKANNVWINLREATKSQNAGNARKHRDNSTGFKGVRQLWNGSYQAILWTGYKQQSQGIFNNPEDAAEAYLIAAKTHFKEFSHDGS